MYIRIFYHVILLAEILIINFDLQKLVTLSTHCFSARFSQPRMLAIEGKMYLHIISKYLVGCGPRFVFFPLSTFP